MLYKNPEEEMEEFFSKCVALPTMGEYGWEWDVFVSYYDPRSKKFYWADAGGCSCNTFEESVTSLGDYTVGNKAEYLKAASAYEYNGEIDNIRRAVFGLK